MTPVSPLLRYIQRRLFISAKSIPGLTYTTANALVMNPPALSPESSSSSYVSAKDDFEQDSASSATSEAS